MPALHTSEITHNLPILIIDRQGSIGLGLYAKVHQYVKTVLVGGQEPKEKENLLYLPFEKGIPTIPHDQYSHIFLHVEEEKNSFELLDPCFKKAQEDNAVLILIFSKDHVTEKSIADVVTKYKHTSLFVYGDMIDNPYATEKNFFDTLFYAARMRHSIKLVDMGFHQVYPASFSDTVTEIIKIAFTPTARGIYLGYPNFPVTQLRVVHALQKVDPLIKIDFTAGEKQKEEVVEGEHVFGTTYPVFAKIEQAYRTYKVKEKKTEEKIVLPPPVIYKKKKREFSTKQRWGWGVGIFIFTCLLLPWIVFSGGALIGRQELLTAKDSLEKGNVSAAKQHMFFASSAFSVSSLTFPLVNVESLLVGQGGRMPILEETITTAQQITTQCSAVLDALSSVQAVFAGKSNSQQQDMLTALAISKRALTTLERIVSSPTVPQEIQQKIADQTPLLHVFSVVSDVLPEVLGVHQDKTYLVLFQNNMELRPGGGFIGSYGLLHLHTGVVQDFTIHNVYDADGQLKGHTEPPFAVRRYLPSAHLYLRDSNFNYDFPQNAAIAASLLSQEMGTQVDGVIGVDLSFVKGILSAVGSVYVPEYNQTITPANMFEVIETHSDRNSFAGSTQKQDILRSLFFALKAKIQEGKGVSYGTLARNVVSAISEKHLMFAFNKPSVQDVFTANGLSSSLWDGRTSENNTLLDFLGINEANLGVNKVNYFVQRAVDQQVSILSDGTVNETVTITFTNTSDGSWPGGEYRNFLRIALPTNALLTDITIGGEKESMVPAVTDFTVYERKNFVPPAGLEVQKDQEQGKTIYGFLLTVPKQSTVPVAVSYTLAQRADIVDPTFGYNLRLVKQPGVEEYPYSFSFAVPAGFKPLTVSNGMTSTGEKVTMTKNIKTDESIDLHFGKQ